MEDLEIFDKSGKVLHIADLMRSFLKDNLAIQIVTNKERDYGDEYTVIEVSISLEGQEICKSSDKVW